MSRRLPHRRPQEVPEMVQTQGDTSLLKTMLVITVDPGVVTAVPLTITLPRIPLRVSITIAITFLKPIRLVPPVKTLVPIAAAAIIVATMVETLAIKIILRLIHTTSTVQTIT